MAFNLIRLWLSSKQYAIWSPITMITLTLFYYIVMPSFNQLNLYGANTVSGQHLFYIGAVIFYLCVMIGFSFKQKDHFKRWNNILSERNAQSSGIMLFIIALVCYIPFRGFRTTIWAEDSYMLADRTGFVSYFIDLISLFCASCGLLFMHYRASKKQVVKGIPFFMVLYMTIIMYIVGGFRYRLVHLILSLATVYHLYPKPRRLNYSLIIIVAAVAFIGFAIMDVSRRYGAGIDREAALSVSLYETKGGARENKDVCCYSIVTMDDYDRNGGYVFFEPIVNAILMPIPRAVFPWKPDGDYMRIAQVRSLGSWENGCAFLCFVEAFISFGWLGIIIYGLFIGWVSGLFWSNYKRNANSMGAILLLALFNGFCYFWLSRGYLGGNLTNFLYYVIVPFWLISFFRTTLSKFFTK